MTFFRNLCTKGGIGLIANIPFFSGIGITPLFCGHAEKRHIITGCSHSGICNIIAYAQKVLSDNRIADVIGGFHLLNPSKKQLTGTLDFFSNIHPDEVHACHCTDLQSKIALSRVANIREVGVGLSLVYE